jgi:hypothetical protein
MTWWATWICPVGVVGWAENEDEKQLLFQ